MDMEEKSCWNLLGAFISIFCFVIGIVGNLLTLALFYKFKKFRNNLGMFILSLTIVDLLSCFLVIPINSCYFFFHGKWTYGEVPCFIGKIFSYATMVTTVINIGQIAINRCFKISYSHSIYKKVFTKLNLACMLIFSRFVGYVTAGLVSSGVGGKIVYDEENMVCNMQSSFAFYVFIGVFSITIVILAVCYTKIFLTFKSSKNSCQQNSDNARATETQILKTVLATNVSFLICFLPPTVLWFVSMDPENDIDQNVVNFFFNVPYFVSVIVNPIIYGAMNTQYRKGYMEILTKARRAPERSMVISSIGVNGRTTSLFDTN
ncbi:G-protein coupled receptor moody-like [Neocloeon triangulifer]|uniref:G-protein coupled receptor moody-like n=1 Tax=Neocloeon triangulifer TaxID=2078957 RepID=UPI00286F0A1D|nr:G-protein coupled receptor moody-like [Neocloeon triangulifer]